MVQSATVGSAPPQTLLCGAGAVADHVLFVIHGIVESAETGLVHTRSMIAAAAGERLFPHALQARTEVRFARVALSTLEDEGALACLDDVAPRILESLFRRELVSRASAVFGTLDDAALAQIERESEWLNLKRGDLLVRQGEPGDSVFVLLAGRLQVVHTPPGGRP
ncbi:MAG: cyclic nucleotide-binding domain-containing protein, partial [Vicinamibacterales bacterium]